jgi:hypothetical protein
MLMITSARKSGVAQDTILPGLGVRLPHEELLVVQLVRDAHVLAHELHDRVLRHVRVALGHDQHLDAGGDQERAEDVEDPVVLLHQRSADADHDAAQHDHRDDAPDQGAVLVLPRDREEGEDQADDEDVVDGQRLLDEEAGEVGQAGMRAVDVVIWPAS